MKCSVYAALLLAVTGVVPMRAVEIQLRKDAQAADKTAAAELQHYIKLMTGEDAAVREPGAAQSPPVILLTEDPAAEKDAWKIESTAAGVTIAGGAPQGVIFGAYHYLEECCGVRWWNPWEESVPKLEKVPVDNLTLSGKPAFDTRVLYSFSGGDEGRYCTRMRFTADGEMVTAGRYGGTKWCGGPYFNHTFGKYVPSKDFFGSHPEWFALVNGKRLSDSEGTDQTQPCLSNPGLRRAMLDSVREWIRKEYAEAKANGRRPPRIVDVSQNDNNVYCQCDGCQAIANREGGKQSGVILDFMNELAGTLGKEYPELMFQTFAYHYSEEPPDHLKPLDNVIVVLTDTTSNEARPLTEAFNPIMVNRVKKWAKIAKNLKIWDYAITFTRKTNEQAFPSEFYFQNDMRFFRDNNVTHMFTEMEEYRISDVRDYKVYLYAHVEENPDLDFDTLSRDFAHGFYGPQAGPLFRDYRQMLLASVEATNPWVGWFPPAKAFSHLTYEVVSKAQALFDEGGKRIGDDPVLQRRWRHARLSLDRSTLIRSRILVREFTTAHPGAAYPIDHQVIADRIRTTWTEQATLRLPEAAVEGELKEMGLWLAQYGLPVNPRSFVLPARFKDIMPASRVYDFTFEDAMLYNAQTQLVDDPDSLSGRVASMKFADPANDKQKVEKYLLPQSFGTYSDALSKSFSVSAIKPEMVTHTGYEWYHMGKTRLVPDMFFYTWWSWEVQEGIGSAYDSQQPDVEFDLWLHMKVTGPQFPCGKPDEVNAYYFDRLVLVKALR
jgi:hypothetical protein